MPYEYVAYFVVVRNLQTYDDQSVAIDIESPNVYSVDMKAFTQSRFYFVEETPGEILVDRDYYAEASMGRLTTLLPANSDGTPQPDFDLLKLDLDLVNDSVYQMFAALAAIPGVVRIAAKASRFQIYRNVTIYGQAQIQLGFSDQAPLPMRSRWEVDQQVGNIVVDRLKQSVR